MRPRLCPENLDGQGRAQPHYDQADLAGGVRCRFCNVAPSESGLEEGRRRADAGAEKALERAKAEWKTAVFACIRHVNELLEYPTNDDVWEEMDARGIPRPKALGFDARAYGAVTKRAVKLGLWDYHGWSSSTRPGLHGSPVRVYRSLIYGSHR